MSEIRDLLNSMLLNDCPLEKVSELVENVEVSDLNNEVVEEIVNLLKIHEAEIRILRQNLSAKLRNHKMEKTLKDQYLKPVKKLNK
jgi:hypothetical protein